VYGNNQYFQLPNLTNLSWDVYVKDANGCIDDVTVVSDATNHCSASSTGFEGTALTVDLSPNKHNYL
jgi:hypothetical protein